MSDNAQDGLLCLDIDCRATNSLDAKVCFACGQPLVKTATPPNIEREELPAKICELIEYAADTGDYTQSTDKIVALIEQAVKEAAQAVEATPCLDMPYPRSNQKNSIYIQGQLHMRNRCLAAVRRFATPHQKEEGGE